MAFTVGSPAKVIAVIVAVRLLSVAVVQTWYVPDEYWQSLEVAHRLAFGYGELTWEWEQGIRSYLYPGIIAALYAVLKITGLDYPEVVVLAPRVLQALLSAAGDYSLYVWSGRRKWTLFLSLTSWFWFYIGSRTLLQSVELALVCIGLSLFPFNDGKRSYYEKESSKWVWVACLCTFLRPSSGALWAVLGARQLTTTTQPRLRLLVRTYLPAGLVTCGVLAGLDSWLAGRLVLTPWEFVRFNVLHGVSSFYGTHPWYWYLSTGLPAVLGASLPLALWGVYSALRTRRSPTTLVLLGSAALPLLLLSVIPHKEFRFVAPLLPVLLYLAQDAIVPWSRKASKWQLYGLALLVVAGNAVPAVYFGQLHQAGTTSVMPLLRDALPHANSSVTFLMPCHSTPLYSHLHVNVSTRYLHCSPLQAQATEAERFFNNPQRWWREEHARRAPPAVLVMFDVLRGRVEQLLQDNHYELAHDLPHTQFPEGEVGARVLVYRRGAAPASGATPAR